MVKYEDREFKISSKANKFIKSFLRLDTGRIFIDNLFSLG